ncbi:replication restart helicase PriA [Candidatus Acetatifactor stercoripullorum]|uniref:replication restart helicase PriA n=1 Tax=Candidatus Acetatifactor stercoripullorum TaxID=2838414 RepID=UPI00298E8B27|nr:primosomal protein N' [Candidatus Acetatifactor stercoripullorum]
MTKEQYADVIVDISHEKLDRPFQYRVPEKLLGALAPGMCVAVPFGKGNRLINGYVLSLSGDCRFDPGKIKDIAGIVKGGVAAQDKMILLADWMRRNYGSTMIQALKTVLPAKKTVGRLEHKYLVRLLGREEILSLLGESIRKKQTAKERLLRELAEREEIPYGEAVGSLGVSPSTISSLEKAGAIRVESQRLFRNPVKLTRPKTQLPALSAGQQQIVDQVISDFDKGERGTYLVHGITGSGKTEVYMQLIGEMLKRGRQAIVLIPEIALTYQTLLRFFTRFGDRVSVLNSTLSLGEKYDQCERAKNGEIDVIIGPRSALFTPFPNIGLIVIDEEHESSYKSESSPKYHARETAIEVARLHGASVVLGSATPSLEAYYRARKGEYGLFTLKERLTGGALPQIHTVDLRKELKEGNRSIFSRKLQTLLAGGLERGEQSILFLNRRGYAGFVSCRACGYVMKCPHCDVSLSEHKNGLLICHYCGFQRPKPAGCPQCGSKYIMGFRAGTQQIEEKLKELFPGVRTLRMDGDTTKTKDSYEKILSAFAAGEADVLIGTQMIVKGHDFPRVTLVGILAADLSLGAADYRAGERTFQLLTQAAGRAGRGTLPGQVVIQTYQPEHYAIQRAAAQDYEGFYQEEILYRELMGYPPVCHMLAVQIFSREEEGGKKLAGQLAQWAGGLGWEQDSKEKGMGLRIIGPAPGAIGRINDIFRFVFYVKHENYDKLVQIKDLLEEKLETCRPLRESVQFDFDPVNVL